MVATDDARVAFRDCHVALLVGARPRGPGMERKDLLLANAQIFSAQGKALNEVADRTLRVLVVGNPANTNALIASRNAPGLERRNFTAMTRLDHNRALSQLAEKTGAHVNDIRRMTIWGNHSSTQYPDISHTLVDGKPASGLVDQRVDRGAFHSDGAAARRRRHQGPRLLLGGVRGLGRDRSRAHLDARHRRGRLDQHGHSLRRQLRHRGGPDLLLSGDLQQRRLPDRARTSRSTNSAASAWTLSAAELREERDGVRELLGG